MVGNNNNNNNNNKNNNNKNLNSHPRNKNYTSSKTSTAESAYNYIVYSRFLAVVELILIPFAFISLLFYPCYSRLLL